MFGRKKEEDLPPKGSVLKSLKKLILVACLFFCGGLLVLGGFDLIHFDPQLLKYTGFGLLGLALIYNYLY